MDTDGPSGTVRIALLFEAGLGLAAIGIGWLIGHSPLVGMSGDEDWSPQLWAIGWGLIATGPLLVVLYLTELFPWEPLRNLHELTAGVILRMFGGASVAQLALVAIAAGCGEELLFRGLVQAAIARWIGGHLGVASGLVIAAILFGLCHWLNATYAWLAVLAGIYFGLAFAATDSIWTPIVAHAAYDFVALMYLVRPVRLVGLG